MNSDLQLHSPKKNQRTRNLEPKVKRQPRPFLSYFAHSCSECWPSEHHAQPRHRTAIVCLPFNHLKLYIYAGVGGLARVAEGAGDGVAPCIGPGLGDGTC